jgi:hypothetical protein
MTRTQQHRLAFLRRAGLASLAVWLCLWAALVSGAAPAADLSKARAWAMAEQLSRAAVQYASGAEPSAVSGMLSDAQAIARDLGMTIARLPERSADAGAQMDYLVAGDGWAPAAELARRFGGAHAALYEIALKANLLLLSSADQSRLARAIADRSQEVGLPTAIWQPAVALAIANQRGEALKRAVARMHDEAIRYLGGDTLRRSAADGGGEQRPALQVQIELAKASYTVGDPFTFAVVSNRDCYFLVFTVDATDKVEIHDPVASGEYMGHPLLKAGERREIPVPGAPGRAVITLPVGTYEIGAVCGREELSRFGLSRIELKEPSRAGRRSFQFHLGERVDRVDRDALSQATVSYEVRPR